MSINELWSVLSHGALEQFDPDAKAEELDVKDYDNILENAVLVDDYTLQVQHDTKVFAVVAVIMSLEDFPWLLLSIKLLRSMILTAFVVISNRSALPVASV